MPSVQEDILKAFCAKLAKSRSIDAATVEALCKTLTGKKLKADDVVAMLQKEQPSGTP
jgi:nitrate reductase assembly molybdenum cofactor insertion protein NarJ